MEVRGSKQGSEHRGATLGGEILGFRAGLRGAMAGKALSRVQEDWGHLSTCWSARSEREATGGANMFSRLDLASGLGEPPCD